jgi:transposase
MTQQGPFELETEIIGSLPIINHFVERLKLRDILERHLATPRDRKVSPATCIGVFLRNIIVQRTPVYSMQEWLDRFRLDMIGVTHEQRAHLNDDRLGNALDILFDTDRATLMTEVVISAIKEFGLDLSQLHNDATSVTFTGKYIDATGGMKRGKKTQNITWGHNQDHRPDLKQLLWFLIVTADGAVPIHYKATDGNAGESPNYRETWDILCKLVGRTDFIYVADCKLCSTENLMYIDTNGGRFITILPRNRNEDGWFRDHIQRTKIPWIKVEHRREEEDEEPPDIWRMFESPMRSAEGFRVAWAFSTRMAERDKDVRHGIMADAVLKLEQLETRLRSPRNKLRSRESVIEAADTAIGDAARRWMYYTITEEEQDIYRQEKRGRPNQDTNYRRTVKKKYHVTWNPIPENIEFDAKSDGMYPLITNCEDLSLGDILAKYKFQPRLEKRHEQFKTVYGVMPMLLKNVTRIEGLLFVYFLALLIEALIEREVRRTMALRGLKTIPIYPEMRECAAPTSSRILRIFEPVQLHRLRSEEKLVQVFRTELTDLQKDVLGLAGVSAEGYVPER